MRLALDEMRVEGIATNLPLHRALARDAAFAAGGVDIHHLERWLRRRSAGVSADQARISLLGTTPLLFEAPGETELVTQQRIWALARETRRLAGDARSRARHEQPDADLRRARRARSSRLEARLRAAWERPCRCRSRAA